GLQDITSPDFDPVHRIVWTSWRASCCEHGVTTYRWQGNDVKEVDSASSYLLPVLDGNTRRYCYIVPGYGNGHIEYPQRIEQTDTGLRSTLGALKDCVRPRPPRPDAKDRFAGHLQPVHAGFRRRELRWLARLDARAIDGGRSEHPVPDVDLQPDNAALRRCAAGTARHHVAGFRPGAPDRLDELARELLRARR
ncbi:hypothetical protein KPA97_50095, partial [Burkholderia cenocepacia]|nr:hypothetical protein [Burkholderia cenocepacia]MDR5668103.1 hypothetical protein [Burkholderia cenocepacia]